MAKRVSSAGRKVTGRSGRAWGNALGGYKTQRRVGGKFASGGSKVSGSVATTAKPTATRRKARTSRARVVGAAAFAVALTGAGVGGVALAATALTVPLSPPSYLTAEQAAARLASTRPGRKITR